MCNLNPTSRGTVRHPQRRLSAKPPRAIAPNYLSTPEDRKVAADSPARHARASWPSPRWQSYQPEEFKPGVQYQSDEDLARLAGDIATTIFHPVGTTKMGARRRSHGGAGRRSCACAACSGVVLRVVDAGAMPTITSGNTNSPTLMMAEKAAEWILEGRARRRVSPPDVSAYAANVTRHIRLLGLAAGARH